MSFAIILTLLVNCCRKIEKKNKSQLKKKLPLFKGNLENGKQKNDILGVELSTKKFNN